MITRRLPLGALAIMALALAACQAASAASGVAATSTASAPPIASSGGGPPAANSPSAAPVTSPATAPGPAAAAPTDPVARGELIFQKTAGGVGCQSCHGTDAKGLTGPDIRGYPAARIANALASVEPMSFIMKTTPLTQEDVEALAAYLKTLADKDGM